MFANFTTTHYLLIFLVIIIASFIIVLLLPTILELRKPKDAGPRRITEENTEDKEDS
ncbi:MAG: hypothetical protein PVH73_05470 [Candidatus Bathyarchaeota archaeon]